MPDSPSSIEKSDSDKRLNISRPKLRDTIETAVKGCEIPTEQVDKLRNSRRVIFSLFGPGLINEALVYNATPRQIEVVIRALASRDLVGKAYTDMLDHEEFDKEAGYWDIAAESDLESGNPTAIWFNQLFNQCDHDEQVYQQAQLEHRGVVEKLRDKVNQLEMVQLVATDLFSRYGLSEETQTELLSVVGQNTIFSKPLTHSLETNNEQVRFGYAAASHRRDNREMNFPPDIFFDVENLPQDISFVEHELIHLMKTEGHIQEDVVVPVASAQTMLALHEAGAEIIEHAKDRNIQHFTIREERALQLIEDINHALSPMVLYATCFTIMPDIFLEKFKSLDSLSAGLRQKFGEGEEAHTYVIGSHLGFGLLVREESVGRGYAQNYLVALAQGNNLGISELIAMVAVKQELSFIDSRDVVVEYLRKRKKKVDDRITYTELDTLVDMIIGHEG